MLIVNRGGPERPGAIKKTKIGDLYLYRKNIIYKRKLRIIIRNKNRGEMGRKTIKSNADLMIVMSFPCYLSDNCFKM